ncbi:hypothetical protein ES703_95061 [subsurface metagenome]
MKCPLFAIATRVIEPQPDVPINDCLGEECAWWNKGFGCCQVQYLTATLNIIGSFIEDLVEKMPRGGRP